MKQGLNPRRSRGRGNPRGRHPNSGNRNHQLDSNGPEGRIRGSATQILERYLALARDAQSAGDTVAAENLFQHAEHYFRVINVNGGNSGQQNRPRSPEADDGRDGYDESDSEDGQGRFTGGSGEGWRQPRDRDERHPGRSEDRFRQGMTEQHRQRDGAPLRTPVEAQDSSPRPAGGGDGERMPNEPRRSGTAAVDDPSEHRPAFLRRREPREPREPVSGGSAAPSEDLGTLGGATPGEHEASPSTPSAVESAAEAAPEEKPKPRARRRRTTVEGEAVARTPRRRSSAKRQAEAEEDAPETVDGRDLETSV